MYYLMYLRGLKNPGGMRENGKLKCLGKISNKEAKREVMSLINGCQTPERHSRRGGITSYKLSFKVATRRKKITTEVIFFSPLFSSFFPSPPVAPTPPVANFPHRKFQSYALPAARPLPLDCDLRSTDLAPPTLGLPTAAAPRSTLGGAGLETNSNLEFFYPFPPL